MRRGVRRAAACAALALALWGRDARADVATATETFRTAMAAFARKDYRAAALAFELSNKLVPAGAATYNAGLAWAAAGEKARAADDFAEALARPAAELSDAERADAKKQLDALELGLGRARVDVPGAVVSVSHAERRPSPTVVHLPPGEHEISLEVVGKEPIRRKVTITAGAEVRVDAGDAPPPPRERQPGEPDGRFAFGAQHAAGLALGGAALVGGAIAIGAGVGALDARDAFFASGLTDVGAHDRADALRAVANVAWAAAGVCLVTGVVLFATAPRARAPRAFAPPLVVRF